MTACRSVAPPPVPARYVTVEQSGAIYDARSNEGQVLVSSPDAAVVIQAAVDNLRPAGGDIRIGTGRFVLNGPVRLPPDLRARLTIEGRGRDTTLLLDHACYPVFTVRPERNSETFRHFVFRGFQVDGNNVGCRFKGVVFGEQGTFRANFEDLRFQHIRSFDVPVSVTDYLENHRGHILVDGLQDGPGDDPNTIRDIEVSDCSFEGGDWGVLVTGFGRGGSDANIRITDVVIENCTLDQTVGGVPQGSFPSTAYHVGGRAAVGRVRISHVKSNGSGDNCVEVNNAEDALIEDVLCVDPAVNGITIHQYAALRGQNPGVNALRNVDVIVTRDAATDAGPPPQGISRGHGIAVAADDAAHAIGAIDVAGYTYTRSGTAAKPGSALIVQGAVAALSVRDARIGYDDVVIGAEGLREFAPVDVNIGTSSDTPSRVSIRDLGERVRAGAFGSTGATLRNAFDGRLALDVDRMTFDWSTAGPNGLDACVPLVIGTRPGTVVQGQIRGVSFKHAGSCRYACLGIVNQRHARIGKGLHVEGTGTWCADGLGPKDGMEFRALPAGGE